MAIFDAETLPAIDGLASSCTKSDWYDVGYPQTALNMFREQEEHDSRRKVWNNAFGMKGVFWFLKAFSRSLTG